MRNEFKKQQKKQEVEAGRFKNVSLCCPLQGSESKEEDVWRQDACEDDRRHPDQSAASHAALHQVSPASCKNQTALIFLPGKKTKNKFLFFASADSVRAS